MKALDKNTMTRVSVAAMPSHHQCRPSNEARKSLHIWGIRVAPLLGYNDMVIGWP